MKAAMITNKRIAGVIVMFDRMFIPLQPLAFIFMPTYFQQPESGMGERCGSSVALTDRIMCE
jgi:hypothetical protein